MKPNQIFDYGIPYNIFTGLWTCVSASFDPRGEFIGSVASNVGIFWLEPYTKLAFRQGDSVDVPKVSAQLRISEVAVKLLSLEFNLKIVGKHAESEAVPDGVKNEGAETTSDCYIFKITAGDYVWYNNQYCATANERRVIGPQLYDGEVQLLLSQHLIRISYEVPPQYDRALKPFALPS
jgi:hypothetical protein